MQLSLQLSKLQGTTSYFDENVGRVGVKSDTVILYKVLRKTKIILSDRICRFIHFSRNYYLSICNVREVE